jgi:molybdate transport system substrate-binding protein
MSEQYRLVVCSQKVTNLKTMRVAVISALLGVFALTACGSSDTKNAECSVTVAAASSLSKALTDYEERIESASWCSVEFVFGSSASLAAQIAAGAPIDIFLSASREAVQMAGYDREAAIGIARTRAAIWVSPYSTFTFADLAAVISTKSAQVGLCAPGVPCGALADLVLSNAGHTRDEFVDTESTNADDLLLKVRFGELDAAVGFASACASTPEISCVEIPMTQNGEALNAYTDHVGMILTQSPDVRAVFGVLNGEKFIRNLIDTYGFEAL